MKPLFTIVAFAMCALTAYAAEAPTNPLFVVPDTCVWIEMTASNLSLDADGPGGIFAKHGNLTRAEDLRASIAEITFFDESGINGPPLPFDGILRLFGSGTTCHQVHTRSTPAELFVRRGSNGVEYGLWIDRETRFPLRFAILRPFSFVWREFFLLEVPNPPSKVFATGSITGTPDLRVRYTDRIKEAKISFEALLAEQAWRIEKLK